MSPRSRAQFLGLEERLIDLDILGRLAIAAGSGGLIGLQFDLQRRPGGLRAHALTAMGAALFCATAQEIAAEDAEVIRVIQGVASGVGFIGAGSVLRGTGYVQGVTTAASLWISAALGCSASLGDWRIPLTIAVFVAALNAASFYLERVWLRRITGGHRNCTQRGEESPGESSSDSEAGRSSRE